MNPHIRPNITPDDLPPAWREQYEERAGIMEYDGNMTRERAEHAAMTDTLGRMAEAKR